MMSGGPNALVRARDPVGGGTAAWRVMKGGKGASVGTRGAGTGSTDMEHRKPRPKPTPVQ